MALGDSLNSLAGGYARGQAQYAANEEARQKQAQAAAKAAQDAAEFRLRLAQHDQTLMNSAESEWKGIMDIVTADDWTPAKLPTVLPRVANFQKTYGKIWGGGDAMEQFRQALHLNGTGQSDGGQAADNPMMGWLSPEQKAAADQKALDVRSSEAARDFTVQAMEYVRDKTGGLPEEAEFYRRIYDFQEQIMRSGQYDPKIIDDAMDIIRENAAGYYKGLANGLDNLAKNTALSDAISERTDKVGREASAWIKSILLMDANGNPLAGDLFAERSPLQLEMERTAQSLAMNGMSTSQVKANLIFKYRDEMGRLNLDISATPYAGSLTLMDAPIEFRNAVNRFYDLNEDPNEDQIVPMWREADGTGWVVNTVTGEGREIYRPIQTPETPSVIMNQGTRYPRVPAESKAVVTSTPQQAPAREVSIQLRDGSAERASRAEASAATKAARDREKAARKEGRMAAREAQRAEMQAQQEIADRNNRAFRLYRSGKITEQEFQEELRRAKAGEPSLIEESR